MTDQVTDQAGLDERIAARSGVSVADVREVFDAYGGSAGASAPVACATVASRRGADGRGGAGAG